ncbi:MAG: hypothetical protein CM15mP12_4030 [Gammaproteobacteria bacterium]|nr:MAG: hypothetical protein CM15mP12_4030 [Gammaproteobacteria bacterium]
MRSLIWFRNDLRVDDNPALSNCCVISEGSDCCLLSDRITMGATQ